MNNDAEKTVRERDGYCNVIAKSGEAVDIAASEFERVSELWDQGKSFAMTIDPYGDAMKVKLSDVWVITRNTPERIRMAQADNDVVRARELFNKG